MQTGRLAEAANALGAAAEDELSQADAFAALVSEVLADVLEYDFVLVLDDVHELTPSKAAIRLVESLCRQAPATLHVVLASRSTPPFAIERLRAEGELLELSAADLAFAKEEIAHVVAAVSGEADPELAAALHELTGGWPALVRLALEALRTAPAGDRVRTVDTLRRPGGSVFAYLAVEVFGHEPPAVRDLVRTAALLDSFTPELCEALGLQGSAEAIHDLARRAFFIERRDGGYALHSLARDFALHAWPFAAGEAAALRRRAARWLEAQGQLEEALRALTSAGDDRELLRVLTDHGASLVAAGATAAVVAAAELVPDDHRDATIDQLAGEAHSVNGEHERALECFARAAGAHRPILPSLAWRMVQAHSLRDELDEALAVYERAVFSFADSADEALLFAWTASVQRRRIAARP